MQGNQSSYFPYSFLGKILGTGVLCHKEFYLEADMFRVTKPSRD